MKSPHEMATRQICALVAVVLLAATTAQAAIYYWDTTTTGLWSTGGNWSDNAITGGTTGVVPTNDITTDTVVFNQSSVNGAETVQLDADTSIAGITFANTGTTLLQSDSATPRLLTIGGSGLTINSGAGAVTLGNATNVMNLVLGAAQSWTNNSTSTLTVVNAVDNGGFLLTIGGTGNTSISGAISGAGGLTKAGAGRLTLSVANNYTGGTTLSAGTLILSNTAALGAAGQAIILNGGMLDLHTDTSVNAYNVTIGGNVGIEVDRATSGAGIVNTLGTLSIGANTLSVTTNTAHNVTANTAYGLTFGATTLTGNATFDVANNGTGIGTLTLGAVGESGVRGITKSGAGTLMLTGANTYTGTTTISGGTLTVGDGSTGSLGATPSTFAGALTFNNSGTFNVAEATGSNQMMGALTFTAGDGNVTSTAAGGAGNLATLTFASLAARTAGATGNFTLAANTTVGENKILLTSTTNAPLTTGSNDRGLFFGGAEYARYDATNGFRATAYGTDTNALALVSGTTIGATTIATDIKLNGAITGQTSTTVNTINLGGANSITFDNVAQILSVNGILASANATLVNGTNVSTIRAGTAGGELVIRVDGASNTLGIQPIIANFTSASALTKSGAGTLNIVNLNTYTGATTIDGGTLQIGGGGNLQAGNYAGAIAIRQGATFTWASTAAQTLSGNITGTGSFILNNASASLTLSGASNTYSGGFTLNNGTVNIGNGTYGGFGTGTFTASNGNLWFTGGSTQTINNNLSWGGGNLVFSRSAGGTPNTTWTGTLTLTGNQTLQLGASTTANNSTFTGNISGAYGITVTGTGASNTLTLSGTNNTFSGGLNLSVAAALNINSTTALGTGTFTIGAAGVINNTSLAAITLTNDNPLAVNSNFTFTGTRDLNMGTGAVNLGAATRTITTTAGVLTLGGVISNGGLTKSGAGTLALAGSSSNTYATVTTMAAGVGGTLQLAKTGTAQAIANGGLTIGGADNSLAKVTYTGGSSDMMGTGTVTINGRSRFDFNGHTDTIGNVAIVNTGAVSDVNSILNTAGGGNLTIGTLGITPVAGLTTQINSGTGTLTLGGTVTFTAATTGRARITGTELALGGATRTFNVGLGTGANQDLLIDAAVTGSVGLTKTGTGRLTLSGTNSYTGLTTVSDGTLTMTTPSSLGNGGLNVAAAKSFIYAPTTAGELNLGSGALTLAGGAAFGTALGGTASQSAITSTGAAALTGTGTINIYSIPGVAPTAGTNNLITAASGLTGGTYTLGAVFNNTDYTVSGFTRSATAISVNVTSQTALSNAYWRGNQVTGFLGTMSASTGTLSNWASDAAGTASGLTPGSSTNVIFGATGAALQASVITGLVDMSVNSITFNDSTAVTIAGSLNTITLNSTSGTAASTSGALATVTAGSAISVTSFANATNTISANLALGANQTWNVASGKTLAVSGIVSGAGSLTKADAGTVTLTGSNIYTGGTTISVGTVKVGSATALGANSSAVSVTSGAVLDVNGITMSGTNALTLNGSGIGGTGALINTSATAATYAGAITLNSASTIGNTGNSAINSAGLTLSSTVNNNGNLLTFNGTGRILLGAASGISGGGGVTVDGVYLNLQATPAANMTYGGTTTIQNGGAILKFNNIANATGNIVLNGGYIDGYSGDGFTRALGTGANQIQITGGISGFGVYGSGTVNLGGAGAMLTWGTATFNPTELMIGTPGAATSLAGTTTFANAIDLNGTTRTILANGGAVNIGAVSGVISNGTGTAGLIKTGAGTLTLSAANTFNGTTTISAGTLNLTNALALQNSALDTTNSVAGGAAAGLKITTATTLTLGGLIGNKDFDDTAGSVFTTTSGGYNLVTGLTLNVGTGNSYSYSGVIGNGAATTSLTKSGLGTQTLTGSSIYTGATTISAGTLALGNGGNLLGSATVGSAVSVTGTLAVSQTANATSNAIGQVGQTTASTLTFNAGSALNMSDTYTTTLNLVGTAALAPASGVSPIFTFDLNGASNGTTDLFAISGAATAGAANVTIAPVFSSPGSLSSSNTYTVMTAASGLGTANFTLGGQFNYVIGGSIWSTSLATSTATSQIVSFVNTTYAPTTAYWQGGTDGSWISQNGTSFVTNFTQDIAGAYNWLATPVSTSSVFVGTTAAANLSAMTLDQAFSIVGLTYNGTGTSNTAGSTLAAGTGGSLTIGTGGIAVLSGSGANTISAPVTLGGAQSWTNNSANLLMVSGTVTNGANNLTVNGTGNTTISGNLGSGSGTLTKDGAGTLTLSGVNAYSGLTTLTTGTLILSGSNSSAGATTVSGGILQLNSNSNGGLASGTFTVGAATIQALNADRAISQAITLNGNATFSGNYSITSPGQMNGGAAARILTNNITAGRTLNIAGYTSSTGNLNFQGTGTTIMNNAITLGSGQLIVDAGTVMLNSGGQNTTSTLFTINAAGTVIARGTTLGSTLSMATGSSFSYVAATDVNMTAGSIVINSGTNTTLGGSIGSTTTSARINTGSNVTVPNSTAVKVNVYGVGGVTRTVDGNYELIRGGSAGATTLNNGIYTLGTVFNNTDFTVGAFTKSTTVLSIAVARQTALTGAYWKGGLSGNDTVWAASNGTSSSNWATTSGGTVQALVPGAGADVTIDGSYATAPTSTRLGADVHVKTLTLTNSGGLGINADGFKLTITPSAATDGITIGTGVAASTIASNVGLGAAQTWTNNSTNALTVSGVISGGGANSLTTAGTGTTILSGVNTYTGTTTASQGTLVVNGSIVSATTVASGATLGGSGTINNSVTIQSGGFVNPGNSPDVLDVVGAYTQAGTYNAEIAANTVGNGTTGYDQINVTGTVDITGGSLVTAFSGASYSANDLIFILLNDSTDAITGTYASFVQGATVTTYGGYDWTISYTADYTGGTNTFTGGNDIALMAVAIPEPSVALLGGLSLLGLVLRRRRH